MRALSFRTGLLLIITGVGLVVGTVTTLTVRHSIRDQLAVELQEKGSFIAQHLANASANHVLTNDTLELQLHTNDWVGLDPDIVYATAPFTGPSREQRTLDGIGRASTREGV